MGMMNGFRSTLIALGMLVFGSGQAAAQAAEGGDELRLRWRQDDARLHALAKVVGAEALAGKRKIVIEIDPADPAVAAPADPAAGVGDAAPRIPAGLRAMSQFRGKSGHDKNLVHAATRAGDVPELKLVALAPGDEGTTIRPQPRFWWHQSAASRNGELEFILTEIQGRRPRELLRVPLAAMPAGYNSFDLANPTLNPNLAELSTESPYQWTIVLRGNDAGSAVFAKVKRLREPTLEEALRASPDQETTLKSLSDSGNWYELFDTVALLARRYPGEDEATSARWMLLKDAGIGGHLADRDPP